MPVISQRGVEIPSSPIRKLTPLANNAKARGIKVYHLNIGQPDLHTPESALEAVRRIAERGKVQYTAECRAHALKNFRKEERYADYLKLYESITTR